MWMRHPGIRKGRECVIPDVSRTFHFGKTGVNMNNNFYDMYFASKSFNKDRDVTLQVMMTSFAIRSFAIL